MDRNRELVPDNWSPVRERAWPLGFVRKDAAVSAWVSAEEHICCQAGLHPGCASSLMNFVQLLSTLRAVARLSKHVCSVTEVLVIVQDYWSNSQLRIQGN